MQNIIFYRILEDITLILKEKQTTAINIDFFFKTRGNNLKSLASIFQVELQSISILAI